MQNKITCTNPWLKYNQLRYTTVLLPLYQQHFFKQITLNIFTSKYKTGEKNIKGNLVAKGQLAVYKYFSIYAEGCQANEQKLRVKGKTIVVKEYDFIEGFWVPVIYFKKSSWKIVPLSCRENEWLMELHGKKLDFPSFVW